MKVWEETSDIMKSNLWPAYLSWVPHVLSFLTLIQTTKVISRPSCLHNFPQYSGEYCWDHYKFMSQILCIILFHHQALHNNTHCYEMRGGRTSCHKNLPQVRVKRHKPNRSWDAEQTQSPTLLWQVKTKQTEKSRWRIISVGKTLVFIPLLIHKEGFIC